MDEFFPSAGRPAFSVRSPGHSLAQGYQFLKELNPSFAAHLADQVVGIGDSFWRSMTATALSPEVADRVQPPETEQGMWVMTKSGLVVPSASLGPIAARPFLQLGHGWARSETGDLIARARSLPSPETRIAALLTLAPDARAVAAAGAEAEAISDPIERATLLAMVANGAYGDLRTRMLRRALATGRTIKDPAERSGLLAHLAHELGSGTQSAIWLEALRAAASIANPALRAKRLGEIVDSLPQILRSGIFRDIDAPLLYATPQISISALNRSVAERAFPDQAGYLDAALNAIRSIDSEALRHDLMLRLVTRLIDNSAIDPNRISAAVAEPDPVRAIERQYYTPARYATEVPRRDLTDVIYRIGDQDLRSTLADALGERQQRYFRFHSIKATVPDTQASPHPIPRHERGALSRERRVSHEEQPRHVNLWFTGQRGSKAQPLPSGVNLAAGRSYTLRLSIGELDHRSIVTAVRPFPTESLPLTETGNWLEIALASADFKASSRRFPLFLPISGSAWVCPCVPGGPHTCVPRDREYYVNLEVVTPRQNGSARLRLVIYCNRNVVQSHVVRADISDEEGPGGGTSSFIDYTLATGLRKVGDLSPRALSIITNEADDTGHLLMFNGDRGETIALHLTEAQMDEAVKGARRALYAAHIREYGGGLGAQRQLENLYDESNAKDKDGFKADLRKLAEVGRLLWDSLFQDQRERIRELRRTVLADPAVIQVARAGHSTYVFPWALLYEIPMEPGDPGAWEYCPIVDDWSLQETRTDPAPTRCPHEADHAVMNMLCPFGFWGVRHVIEQPPSTPRLVREVVTSTPPPQAVLVTSDQLEHELTAHHLNQIEHALSGFVMRPADSRSSMWSWLEADAMELIYFYCHGLDALTGDATSQPYLGIGEADRLLPGDLGAWFEGRWSDDHWSLTSPLVFINGCHTVAITPGSLVQFVDAFIGVRAAGVVGTEVTVHQRVASEASEVFFRTLRRPGENIGSALRSMRLHLLRKGNVMGLAYTAYCSADLGFVGIPQ